MLVELQTAAASNRVPCPENHRVRVVAVVFTVGGAGDGEVLSVTYSRQASSPIAAGVSAQIESTITRAFGGVDLPSTPPMQANVNPATGAVTTFNQQTDAQVPLPDLWFDFDIIVTAAASAASTSDLGILYEVQPIRARTTRRGRGGP